MVLPKGIWSQVAYTTLATATYLSAGVSIAWSSAATPQLIGGDLGYRITSSEASWVVSLFSFGSIIASFYAKFAVDKWGRKVTIMSAAFMYMTAWALLVFGNSVWYLYVGRTVAGIGFGTTTTAGVMYVGEIADSSIRGGLNTLTKFMINFGQLLGYIVGAFTSYAVSIYIYACITFASFAIGAVLLPESPFYHIKNGNRPEAERVFRKLRNTKNEMYVEEEIDHIQKIVENDMQKKTTFWELVTNKIYRKSLVIILAIKVFQHGSGFFVISSYIQSILEASEMALSPSTSSILYGIMQLIVVMMAVFVVDRFGRKKVLLLSFSGIAVAQMTIGVYFYIQDSVDAGEGAMETVNWIPLASLVLFCFSYNIGVGPINYVLEGEIFPTNVKAAALAFGNVFSNIVSIIIIKLYQIFADSWGIFIPFWMFSGIMLIAIIFVIFVLPETKGRSFDIIQTKLNSGKFFRI